MQPLLSEVAISLADLIWQVALSVLFGRLRKTARHGVLIFGLHGVNPNPRNSVR